jgi:hypothetical protein
MEAAANYTQQTYRIAPGDFLSIRHTFQPEMNQELVRPEGKVSCRDQSSRVEHFSDRH